LASREYYDSMEAALGVSLACLELEHARGCGIKCGYR